MRCSITGTTISAVRAVLCDGVRACSPGRSAGSSTSVGAQRQPEEEVREPPSGTAGGDSVRSPRAQRDLVEQRGRGVERRRLGTPAPFGVPVVPLVRITIRPGFSGG